MMSKQYLNAAGKCRQQFQDTAVFHHSPHIREHIIVNCTSRQFLTHNSTHKYIHMNTFIYSRMLTKQQSTRSRPRPEQSPPKHIS